MGVELDAKVNHEIEKMFALDYGFAYVLKTFFVMSPLAARIPELDRRYAEPRGF
jgi:hypothetical protein